MERTSTLGKPRVAPFGNLDERGRQRARDFGKSILLLAFALLAALYSSSEARAGRPTSAGAAAAVALLVAGWVGLRLAPRLAAAVEWTRLPIVARYRVTRDGYIYLGSLLVVALSAVNTSNNLLYMILSALLSVLAVSISLSGLNFRLVQVSVELPGHCFAGQPFPMEVTIANRKQVFPACSLRIEPTEGSRFDFPPLYLPILGRRGQARHRVEVTLPGRGRHALESVALRSRYPFGFLDRGGAYALASECIAFPEILPREGLARLSGRASGTSPRLEKGEGIDLYMIRDYQSSDSAGRIDWKASAKTSSLKSRQYSAEETPRVILCLDRFGGPGDRERFDRLVSEVASHAVYLTRDGVDVDFVADDWEFGRMRSMGLEPVLHYLALVQMSPNAPRPPAPSGGTALVFTLRGAEG